MIEVNESEKSAVARNVSGLSCQCSAISDSYQLSLSPHTIKHNLRAIYPAKARSLSKNHSAHLLTRYGLLGVSLIECLVILLYQNRKQLETSFSYSPLLNFDILLTTTWVGHVSGSHYLQYWITSTMNLWQRIGTIYKLGSGNETSLYIYIYTMSITCGWFCKHSVNSCAYASCAVGLAVGGLHNSYTLF